MTRILGSLVIGLGLLWAVPALAQNSDNPECLGVLGNGGPDVQMRTVNGSLHVNRR